MHKKKLEMHIKSFQYAISTFSPGAISLRVMANGVKLYRVRLGGVSLLFHNKDAEEKSFVLLTRSPSV